MKHKVSELEGALLDAAVAKAEGVDILETGRYFRPSASWAVAGPIIERERITLHAPETMRPGLNWEWQAECHGAIDSDGEYFQSGTGAIPLIAAMRAYCASKFGEEVDLP